MLPQNHPLVPQISVTTSRLLSPPTFPIPQPVPSLMLLPSRDYSGAHPCTCLPCIPPFSPIYTDALPPPLPQVNSSLRALKPTKSRLFKDTVPSSNFHGTRPFPSVSNTSVTDTTFKKEKTIEPLVLISSFSHPVLFTHYLHFCLKSTPFKLSPIHMHPEMLLSTSPVPSMLLPLCTF